MKSLLPLSSITNRPSGLISYLHDKLVSWEVEILCRRLNIEQGIVSMRVALRYDLLRFSPRSCRFVHLDENYVLILYGYIFTLKSAFVYVRLALIWEAWYALLSCGMYLVSLFFSALCFPLGLYNQLSVVFGYCKKLNRTRTSLEESPTLASLRYGVGQELSTTITMIMYWAS